MLGREQHYQRVDPGQSARSLPGFTEISAPVLAAVMGQPGRWRDATRFKSYPGLAPLGETRETDRKGQPMSKVGPSLLRAALFHAARAASGRTALPARRPAEAGRLPCSRRPATLTGYPFVRAWPVPPGSAGTGVTRMSPSWPCAVVMRMRSILPVPETWATGRMRAGASLGSAEVCQLTLRTRPEVIRAAPAVTGRLMPRSRRVPIRRLLQPVFDSVRRGASGPRGDRLRPGR